MARMRVQTLVLAIFLACSLGAGARAAGSAEDHTETIQSGGAERTYHVHLPPAGRSGGTLPLVLVFHGHGGTGTGAARLTGFNQLADTQGFAVVYPDGLDRRWNDGRSATGQRWLGATLVDDVSFVSALIDRLRGTLRVDPRRIYATGISNGGIFSHRLACDLPDKIAAIAPVAGTIAEPEAPRCAPRTPVSVVEFHGTGDRLVPYGGGEILGQAQLGRVLSVGDTVALWSRIDHCPPAAQHVELAPVHPEDGTRVRRTAYGPCDRGSEVVLYTIVGGGHAWPGTARIPRFGLVSHQIDATRVIWEFFVRHPKI